MFSGRMYSPSPTVRSSRVPFYLLGQAPDLPMGPIDTSFPTPPDIGLPIIVDSYPSTPGIFPSVDPGTDPLIAAGLDPNTADLVYAAAANGNLSNAQFQQILSGHLSTDQINNIIFGTSASQLPVGPFPSAAANQAANLAEKAGGSAAQVAKAAASVTPSSTPAQIAAAVANAMKTVKTATIGPAPRVMVSPVPGAGAGSFFTQSTMFPGVPDVAVAAGAMLLFAAFLWKQS